MNFTMGNLLILSALLASFVLVFRAGERIPAIIALVVSGLEALIAFGLISIRGPAYLGLLLATGLAVAGVWALGRTGTKPTVSAATVVALVGVVQLLLALERYI